jgi:hypothetical protein
LITRDRALIIVAEESGVETLHSVWVIEEMIRYGHLSQKDANSAYDSIVSKRPMFADGMGLDRRSSWPSIPLA